MKTDIDHSLADWEGAGLITPETAAAIRSFEEARVETATTNWPAMLAMAFGGLMLGAGILLFISANWDELSPAARFSIVVGAIGLLHGLAAWSRTKSEILAMTLHAVGTIAVGGGIAVCGQIFNMSSHWSNAIGLWALGAVGAWWVLREWPQFALAAVLVPTFVAAKLEDLFLQPAQYPTSHMGSFAVVIAIIYLSNKAASITHLERRVLVWLGGLAILPALVMMRGGIGTQNFAWERLGFSAAAFFLACALTRTVQWEHILVAAWCAIPLGSRFDSLATHLHLFVGGAGLAAWGVAQYNKLLINWGIVLAGIAIVMFFFSSVFDKLGRSFGLIVAGVVLIGGGFLLDRLRRELIGRAENAQ